MGHRVHAHAVPVVPARAGVIRPRCRARAGRPSRPRASGGHPLAGRVRWMGLVSSPRERGSSSRPSHWSSAPEVVPARAGVIRYDNFRRFARNRRPRASGGHPTSDGSDRTLTTSSPRERGSSRRRASSSGRWRVVPARAGVIRPQVRPGARQEGRPRASGGHPRGVGRGRCGNRSSPRERGSSCCWVTRPRGSAVVPARAGVIRHTRPHWPVPRRRPRASGGHPRDGRSSGRPPKSSPRERGSSGRRPRHGRLRQVVPARAGVMS